MTEIQERATALIIQINIFIDLANNDHEVIDYLKESLPKMKEQVSMGYAFPLLDYSKVNINALQAKTLDAILKLCEVRKNQIEETKRIESKPKLQDEVLKALGF